jgi:hypothetical protein
MSFSGGVSGASFSLPCLWWSLLCPLPAHIIQLLAPCTESLLRYRTDHFNSACVEHSLRTPGTSTRRAPPSTGCMPSPPLPLPNCLAALHTARAATPHRATGCTDSVAQSGAAWHASLLRTVLRCDVLRRVSEFLVDLPMRQRAALRCNATCCTLPLRSRCGTVVQPIWYSRARSPG